MKETKADSENWMCLTITAFGETTTAVTYWEISEWERMKQGMQLKGMFNSVTEHMKCFPMKQTSEEDREWCLRTVVKDRRGKVSRTLS